MWLRKLFGKRNKGPGFQPLRNSRVTTRRGERRLLKLEPLEERTLLSLSSNPLIHSAPFADVIVQESTLLDTPAFDPLAAPPTFDLRTGGDVTPVKDQGVCGSCWAFATYGSLESSILVEGGPARDFSENHLKNYHGFDFGPCDGGNPYMSQAYLTRWSGPVDEADDPYHDFDDRPSPGGPPQYYVRESLVFDTDDEMKEGVIDYGALATNMHWDPAFYNATDFTYYYSGGADSNHGVTIVGWDDGKVTAATNPGAWLAKNSWGTGWGDSGYFWIAYQDTKGANSGVSFNDPVAPDTFSNVYYHDEFGDVNELNNPYAFNAFTPTADEALTAVQFWTQADNANYNVKIYDTFSGGTLSNELATTTGTIAFAGHHTIDLPSAVPLTSGDTFYVYLGITNGGTYSQAFDYAYTGYSSASTASPGQSFYSFDASTWTDLTAYRSTANFSIKALTVAAPDFGDAPDPTYPTLLASDGARHALGGPLYLGAAVDGEADGQPNATATGDDLAGINDEDGVIFLNSLEPGKTANLTVTASAAGGLLNAWVDFNDNGDWGDPGEQVFADQTLVAGPNGLSFAVPAGATVTPQTFARFRVSTAGSLNFTGPADDGEVEDYEVEILAADFGDAPDPTYPTLLASNGARHSLGGALFLGAGVDQDSDGQPDATATGDDLDGNDDEDGVVFAGPLQAGGAASVTVTASQVGRLDAWIDFNDNGDWADAGEKIFTNQALGAGPNALGFAVPANAVVTPQTFARFRVSTAGGLAPTGPADDGEVEDYEIEIAKLDLVITADDPGGNGMNSGSPDEFRLVRNGAILEVYIDGNPSRSFVFDSLASITVAGSDDDDTLIVDYSGGNPIPAGGVDFQGNGQVTLGDSLEIANGTATLVEHTFSNAQNGDVDIDGSTITYTGLEPIIDTITATTREFTFTGGAETITLSDDGEANDNESLIDSTLGESVNFTNPTALLTINATNGADTVNVTGLDGLFSANLTIEAVQDTGSDLVDFTAATDSGGGDLTVRAEQIALSSSVDTGGGNVLLEGDTVAINASLLSGGGTVTIDADADLTFNASGLIDAQTGSPAVALTAGDPVTGGNLTMADGSMIDAAGGPISLQAIDDIFLGRLVTTGAVEVATTGFVGGGFITDSGNTGGADVEAASLVIEAVQQVGDPSDAIETAVGNLEGGAIGGGVFIDNTGPLVIGGILPGVNGILAGNVVRVEAASPITVAEDITGFAVTLTAREGAADAAGDDLTVAAGAIITSGGAINLTAGDDFSLEAGATLTTSGAITIQVDAATTDNDSFGATVTLDPTATINGSGLAITAGDDVDTFELGPDPTTPITVRGEDPPFPSDPGDTLDLDLTGVVGMTITSTVPGDATLTSTSHAQLDWFSIEKVIMELVIDANLDPAPGDQANDTVADDFLIQLDPTSTNVEIYVNGSLVYDLPLAGITGITVNGSDDDDTLTVNSANGLVTLADGITFDGDAIPDSPPRPGDTDTLILEGDPGISIARETYLVGTTEDAGTWVLDPDDSMGPGAAGAANGDEQVITFTGLEPADTDVPAAVFDVIMNTAADQATVGDGGQLNGADALQVTDNGATFETFRFANKTAVRIMGQSGADDLTVDYTTAAAGLATLEIYGHVAPLVLGQPADDNAADQLDVDGTAASVTTRAFGQGGNDTHRLGSNGTLDNISGPVTIDGGAGGGDAAYVLDPFGATQDPTITLTDADITGVAGGVISYANMIGLFLDTTDDFDTTLDVLSIGTYTQVALTTGADAATVTVGNETANFGDGTGNLDAILGTLGLIFNDGVSRLQIDDTGDATGDTASIADNGTYTGIDGFSPQSIMYLTSPGNKLDDLVILAGSGGNTIDVDDTTATGSTTIDSGTGNDSNTVTINADGLTADNTFSGNTGNDRFVLNVAGNVGGTSLVIEGNDPAGDPANRDVLEINDSGAGARVLSIDYSTPVSGDVQISGYAVPVDVGTMETVSYTGSGNDEVTVVATTAPDLLIVTPTGLDSADVELDPGVAGGALGPDLSLAGLDPTDGLMIDGSTPAFFSDPGDTLFYNSPGPAFLEFAGPGAGKITEVGVIDTNFREIEFLDSINPFGIVIDADDAGPGNINDLSGDSFLIQLDAATGTFVEIFVNGVPLPPLPLVNVGSVLFNGSDDDDTLTVNSANGLVTLLGGIAFDGDAIPDSPPRPGDTDTLILEGDPGIPIARETYLVGPTEDAGTWVLDPDDSMGPGAAGATNGDEQVITFTGLEPVDTDVPVAVFDVIMNTAADQGTVEDGGLLGGVDSLQVTDNGATFETFRFANKTTVRIMGQSGADDLTVDYATAAAGLTTLEIYGHVAPLVLGQPADDNSADTLTVDGTTAGVSTLALGQGGDDLLRVGSTFTLDGILGPVTIDGGAGLNTADVLDQNGTAQDPTITLTDTDITGAAAGVITYASLVGLTVNTTDNFDTTLDVLSIALGTATAVDLTTGADAATVTVGNTDANFGVTLGNLDSIRGPVMFLFNNGVSTLQIDDTGDATADTASISDNGTFTSIAGFSPEAISYMTSAGNDLDDLVILAGSGGNTIDVDDTTATGSTTVDSGTGNDSNTVTINADGLTADNTFSGNTGNDRFVLNVAVDVGGTSLLIEGNDPTGDPANRDVLEINDSGTGIRILSIDYPTPVSGDLPISGYAVPVDVGTIETVAYTGSGNDEVTVTATTDPDLVIVTPTGPDSADVELDPGVAGGALGPDLSLAGLDPTDGLMIDGDTPPFPSDPGDTLFYNSPGPAFLDFAGPGAGKITEVGVIDTNFREIEFLDSINPFGIVIDADDAGPGNVNDFSADDFLIQLDAATGTYVEIFVNGVPLTPIALNKVDSVLFNGSDDVDTLTVNAANGLVPLPGGIFFDGEGIPDSPRRPNIDTLILAGDPGIQILRETYTVTGPDSGVIVLDPDNSAGPGAAGLLNGDEQVVTFSNLQPVISTTPAVQLDMFTTSAGDTINVVDGPGAGGFTTTEINDGGTAAFESLELANKITVTVNGLDGADNITLNNPSPADGLLTLELYGNELTGGALESDDNAADRFDVEATAATIATSAFGQGGNDLFDVENSGDVDEILGALTVDGGTGNDDLVVDDTGSAAGPEVVVLTGTTVDGLTGAGGGGGLITYLSLGAGTVTLSSNAAGHAYNVESTAAGLSETELNTGGGMDSITIDDGASTANGVVSPIDLNTQGNANDLLTIVDAADPAGNIVHLSATQIGDGAFGGPVTPGGIFGPGGILEYDADLELLLVYGPDGPGADNTYNVDATGVGLTEGAGWVDIEDGQGNATFNIRGDQLAAPADHIFSGHDGTDTFNVHLAAGAVVSGNTVVISGGDPTGDTGSRDVVNVVDAGGARNTIVTYQSPTGQALVDIDGGTLMDLRFVEQLDALGDGGNDDVVTVVGSAGDDDLAVVPTGANAALVFQAGDPWDGPDTEGDFFDQFPGAAGGGMGPDLNLADIVAGGILFDGGLGGADTLYVHAPSESDLVHAPTLAAAVNPFGFGDGVIIPSAATLGLPNAFDDIDVTDANVTITTSGGQFLPVNLVTPSFVQSDPLVAGLIVNSGFETLPASDGVADDVVVTPSLNFAIQINGGDPDPDADPGDTIPPDGDQLTILMAMDEVNVWATKPADPADQPVVTIQGVGGGIGAMGVEFSSIENVVLDTTAPAQTLNIYGDNNDPAVDQNDDFVLVGTDVDSLMARIPGAQDQFQPDTDGRNELTLAINGSVPIGFRNITTINVFGDDELMTPSVGPDDVDRLEITPYADDTPLGWGIDVRFDEGNPVLDADWADLVVYNGVAGVSEEIIVSPSGPGTGQLIVNNAANGTPILVLDYTTNTGIEINGNDGSAGDTDVLILRGTDGTTSLTSGDEQIEANFIAAGTAADPVVTVSDAAGPTVLYQLIDFTNFDVINFELLAGEDQIAVVGREDGSLTVNIDGGLPEGTSALAGDTGDTILLDVAADGGWYGVLPGASSNAGTVAANLSTATDATTINFSNVQTLRIEALGLHPNSGPSDDAALLLMGTNEDDLFNLWTDGSGASWASVNDGPKIRFQDIENLDEFVEEVVFMGAHGHDTLIADQSAALPFGAWDLDVVFMGDESSVEGNTLRVVGSMDVGENFSAIVTPWASMIAVEANGVTTDYWAWDVQAEIVGGADTGSGVPDTLTFLCADSAVVTMDPTAGTGSVEGFECLPLTYRQVADVAVTTPAVAVQGTEGDDTISVLADGTVSLTDSLGNASEVVVTADSLLIDALGGDDEVIVDPSDTFANGIRVLGGDNGTGSDVLVFTGTGGAITIDLEALTIIEAGLGPVSFSGVEHVNLGAAAANVTVNGTPGDDSITFTPDGTDSGSLSLAGLNTQFSLAAVGDLAVDGLAGSDELTVNATQDDDTIDVSDATVDVNGLQVVDFSGFEALTARGLFGNDTINVTAGAIPIFIDGGDPIGTTAGDLLNLLAGGDPVSYEPGPEDDEGGFLVGSNARISFDHIEEFTIDGGGGPVIILGTNGDDDITVIARDDSYDPAADGVQDFTVSVNEGPNVLYINAGTLYIDALSGDDDVVIRAPAPNGADWDVDVFVAGGPPSASDRLVVETPGTETVRYAPNGADTGTLVLAQAAPTVIEIGPFTTPVLPGYPNGYTSSPGGVEHLVYDGENGADAVEIALDALLDDMAAFVFDPMTGIASVAVSTAGAPRLGIQLQNISAAGSLTLSDSGLADVDALAYLGTAASDLIEVSSAGTITNFGSVFPAVATSGINALSLEGLAGDDTFIINQPNPFVAIQVDGQEPGSSDLLQVVGAAGANEAFAVFPSVVAGSGAVIVGVAPISYNGVEDVHLFGQFFGALPDNDTLVIHDDTASNVWDFEQGGLLNGFRVQIDDRETIELIGFADVTLENGPVAPMGWDVFRVHPASGAIGTLTIDGAGDVLEVFGTGAADAFTLTPTTAAATALAVDFSGVVQLNAFGLEGADLFTVTPSVDMPVFIDGGDPVGVLQGSGDVLDVLAGGGAFQFNPGPEPDSGNVLVAGNEAVSFDQIELLLVDGEVLLLPDALEPNDSIAGATVLGSLPKITLRDLTLHDEGAGVINDDYFQITAQDTGKLVINAFFSDAAGDIDIAVLDASGNVIKGSFSISDDEQVVIPVVSQERYFLHVFSADGNPNVYDLEIENFEAPTPAGVFLSSAYDSGQSNLDNVTFEEQPQLFIQAWLDDFDAEGIAILDAAQVAVGDPGAAVEVFINGASVGIADPLGPSNNFFTFTVPAGELAGGLPVGFPADPDAHGYMNFVSASVRVYDGQAAQASAHVDLSDATLITYDPNAPADPAAPDLLESSDSFDNVLGLFGPVWTNADDVTGINQPAFSGEAEANARIGIFATNTVTGTTQLVGQGVVNSDVTNGEVGDGLGLWEVTIEPLADGNYDVTVTLEDLAGNGSQLSPALNVTVDTLPPQRPTLDLADVLDTGRFDLDNVTNTPNDVAITVTAEDGSRVLVKDGETVIDDFVMAGTSMVRNLPLAEGTRLLSAEAFDVSGNRSAQSEELLVTIDRTAPLPPTIALASYADSGVVGDGITGINPPAFVGTGEANAVVRIFAERVAGGVPSGVVELVGEGFVHSDESDGNPANGLGIWEVTIEPVVDGTYIFSAELEDLAGNISDDDEQAQIELTVDTLPPQRPTMDLVDSHDTGSSDLDNVTIGDPSLLPETGIADFRISAEPGSLVQLKDGEVVIDTFVFDAAFDLTDGVVDGFGLYTIDFNANEVLFGIPAEGPHPLSAEAFDAADNRSAQSEELLVTIDTTAPDTPSTPDLLADSDSGELDDDNVTNVASPAFEGTGEANALVRVWARNQVSGAFQLVGEGRVGSDESDLDPTDGLGIWEVTIEPLADGVYEISAELEDLAGNISLLSDELVVEIDTYQPNTAMLDLVAADDTGRHNNDNVTNVTLLRNPTFTMTTEDPNEADHLIAENLRFRVFDRLEGSAEVLLFDSFGFLGNFTPLNVLSQALSQALNDPNGIALADGVHNLKLEVEDRAGNISQDFLLEVVIDTVAPPVGIADIDPATSDTGVEGFQDTFADRITSDTATGFYGSAEANAVVRLYADAVGNGLIDNPAVFGLTVAVPLDGNEAFPEGQWNTAFIQDLNDPAFPLDGLREVGVTAEDLAGNVSDPDFLEIFLDTQGPRVTDVYVTGSPAYDLFDPKPSDGPTPLVESLSIDIRDLPDRVTGFLYEALVNGGPTLALGNYEVRGDFNGVIPIESVQFNPNPVVDGLPATGTLVISFVTPLPDDRFTLTISDNVVDLAGNALDGETNAIEPQETPELPSGDGVSGGDFTARFTVDSRPEVGVWAAGSVWVDTNGNFLSDPDNLDYVNRDITYVMGYTSDDVFAGNFAQQPGDTADGFDKLAAYGRVDGQFRWLVDTDNDGAIKPGPVPDPNEDVAQNDPANINGVPFAGRFDNNDVNGDEVGIFAASVTEPGSVFHFDTDHDFMVDFSLESELQGYPIVGDFDGDGFDDLATWSDDVFQVDLAGGVRRGWDGVADFSFGIGFIGVRERPVAADMDRDGIDDFGLWVPDGSGTAPMEQGEWYFLISGGAPVTDRIVPDPIRGDPVVEFTPVPFGNDLYGRFGDEFSVPVLGNFDPPVTREGGDPDAGLQHFNGTAGDDTFEFVAGPTADSWIVTVNGEVQDVLPSTAAIRFDGLGGNDVLNFTGTDRDDVADLWAHGGTFTGIGYSLTVWNVEQINADALDGGNDGLRFSGTSGDDTVKAWPGSVSMVGSGFSHSATGFETVQASSGGGENDRAYLYDSAGDDTLEATPTQATLSGDGYFSRAIGFPLVISVSKYGGFDTAQMVDSSGDDEFIGKPEYSKLIGDGFYHYVKWFDEVSVSADAGGSDVATLFGSAGDDTFIGWPSGESTFLGDGYTLNATSFETVQAFAYARGYDVATLHDSPADDRLVVRSRFGKLTGGGFETYVRFFDKVEGVADGGGTDAAYFFDSTGDDVFTASPASAKLRTPIFVGEASGFDSYEARADSGGFDRAYLYDSSGDDTLSATPRVSQLTGTGFSLRTKLFDAVYALGYQGGHDVAHLYDSSGDDTFVGKPENSKLYGEGYRIVAKPFEEVYAHADAGGSDRAFLYDSELDDLLQVSSGWARLSNQELDFLYEVYAFDFVKGVSTAGSDTQDVDPEVDFLELTGDWQE